MRKHEKMNDVIISQIITGSALIGAVVYIVNALVKRKKLQVYTKSDHLRITREIEELREDSDKHERRILILETNYDHIRSALQLLDTKIDKLFDCVSANPKNQK
jgi:hypothetical protein